MLCDSVNLPGLITSVPATSFASSIPSMPEPMGMFAAYWDVLVTQPATAGEVVVNISWSNGITANGSQSLSSPAVGLGSVSEQGGFLGTFFAVCGQPVSYSTTVTGVVGNPVYTLRIRLVSLG